MQEIIQEEFIAPEQFFVLSRQSQLLWNGERQLLLAVFEHALHDFYKYRDSRTQRGKRLFTAVEEWIWSQEQNWLYSFESICLYLGLDPNAMRQRLQRDGAVERQSSCLSQLPQHEEVSLSDGPWVPTLVR